MASGFLRIITNRRIFVEPDSLDLALTKLDSVMRSEGVIFLNPGQNYWGEFKKVVLAGSATGNLVSDAAHAAVAIEHGATWVTFDKDFNRFQELDLKLQ